MSVTCKAVVNLTVEVTIGIWGESCELSQVYSQAGEAAKIRLKKLTDPLSDVRIINEPTIKTVITDQS